MSSAFVIPQVAQFILDNAIESSNGSLCRIICTQPRRISAIAVSISIFLLAYCVSRNQLSFG